MPPRPDNQRWIKRPPRPSRATPAAPPARVAPGWTQALMGVGAGFATAILAVVLAQVLKAPPGVPGFVGGGGFGLGFILVWRGHGGTLQDFRRLFQ